MALSSSLTPPSTHSWTSARPKQPGTDRAQFGPVQVPRYRALIAEARSRLKDDPHLGHHREGLPPEARIFHISQPGRPASHFSLYWVNVAENRIEVLRVLHDAMDIPRFWPVEGS